jgi:hypothetical protein
MEGGAVKCALLLIALQLAGCALRYPPADPHVDAEHQPPTAAELLALLDAPTSAVHLEAPFELRFYPAFVLAGGATWMTCHTPPNWNAVRVATTFEGKFSSDVPADAYQPRLVEGIACGSWVGVCVVLLPSGQTKRIERKIESKGDCTSGGSL